MTNGHAKAARREPETRDMLDDFADSLSKTEKKQIAFVRKTFEPDSG